MRYSTISPTCLVENRRRLMEKLAPNSIAILNANDIMPTNADGMMRFHQNSDLFYLSGIDQEETVLVLYPDAPKAEFREMLFIRETNEHIKIWEGAKLTQNQASEISGIPTIRWLSQIDSQLESLIHSAETIYLNTNEHGRAARTVETRDDRFRNDCQKRFPLHLYARLAPLIASLRMIKSGEEIKQLQEAIDITEKGFRRALSMIKPGVMEFEIEAEFMHEFLINRSRGFSYSPIIASGADSCVLHYVENDKACEDGDILLIDVGAEYAYYAADMTRSIPVNGTFTKRQRQIYDAVLFVMREAATNLMRPGKLLAEYSDEVGALMEEQLLEIGLLTTKEVREQDPGKPVYRRYLMHGTAHHLGLDVHDVGNAHAPIEEGMVFTCEPGIYIPEENLGIRLENDILVKKSGNVDLMANIPIEPDEIESLMKGQ